jgi:MFS family permease
MATLPPLPLLVAAAACGLMYGSIQPVVNLAVQTRTPPGLRCRVIGLLVAAEYAAGPVGYLVAGPAVDSFGVRPTFLGLAAALLLVTVGTMLLPSLRLLGDLPDRPPDETDDHRVTTAVAAAPPRPTVDEAHPRQEFGGGPESLPPAPPFGRFFSFCRTLPFLQ